MDKEIWFAGFSKLLEKDASSEEELDSYLKQAPSNAEIESFVSEMVNKSIKLSRIGKFDEALHLASQTIKACNVLEFSEKKYKNDNFDLLWARAIYSQFLALQKIDSRNHRKQALIDLNSYILSKIPSPERIEQLLLNNSKNALSSTKLSTQKVEIIKNLKELRRIKQYLTIYTWLYEEIPYTKLLNVFPEIEPALPKPQYIKKISDNIL
jgi:hypothetical protein